MHPWHPLWLRPCIQRVYLVFMRFYILLKGRVGLVHMFLTTSIRTIPNSFWCPQKKGIIRVPEPSLFDRRFKSFSKCFLLKKFCIFIGESFMRVPTLHPLDLQIKNKGKIRPRLYNYVYTRLFRKFTPPPVFSTPF